ncbi:MAG: glycerol-3-phosphate responsive antiterminator [Firmicutes bacterium]|jgi:glycerol uptake operon antiterminator|nr:glycerol-3-phosphate responsive antiterminator [Bacillota bacterium]
MGLFDNRKVAASVRTDEDFKEALKSDVEVIFMQNSDILNVKEQITQAHSSGKKVLIHMDFAEGIGKDRAGLNFIKLMGADGILTTKTGMIRSAKDIGLITVQRFFIVDSHSVDTAVESIKIARPDVIEIMPGVLEKKIREFAEKVDTPILAGGLIEFKEEVDSALEAGAKAVSTASKNLWNYK